MAKYFGKIGFVETVDTGNGVWKKKTTERDYFGEVLRNTSRQQSSDTVNGKFNISNKISVIMDPWLQENLRSLSYLCYMGIKWQVTDVEVQYPRMIITIGGEYNGQTS
jgi:hypothetical protein